MQPAPDATVPDGVTATLGAADLTYRVWCPDCRRQLPAFAAALAAAGVPDDRGSRYPAETAADGSKTGPEVEAYDVTRIPTVVVERDGAEVARFVEDAADPVAVVLARRLG